MNVADLQAHVVKVCFATEAPEESLLALGSDRERWLLYRGMVRRRIFALNRSILKSTTKAMGKAKIDEWSSLWMNEVGPKSRFFRQLPIDFAEWAAPKMIEADLHQAAARALHDASRFRTATSAKSTPEFIDFAFDKPPQLNPNAEFLKVAHSIVAKSPRQHDGSYAYLVFRAGAAKKASTRTLTPLLGRVIEMSLERPKATLVELIHTSAAEQDKTVNPRLATDLGIAFANLIEAGAVLGSRAT